MEKRKTKRSRVQEEVIRMAKAGMSVAGIAAATGRSQNAVRQILSRAGVSVQELREERRAQEIHAGSPAAELLAQAADTAAVRELRAAMEHGRPIPADMEPALRAQGFPVGRRQARRAARAIVAELRAQGEVLRSCRPDPLPWEPQPEHAPEPRRVVLELSAAQAAAVEKHLAQCGIQSGMGFWGARLVSRERGRQKYLVPSSALAAIKAVVTPAPEGLV